MERLAHVAALALALAKCSAPPPPPQYEDVAPVDRRGIDTGNTFGVDATFDGDALTCGGTLRSLSQTNAEVIFVLDRSGSMSAPGTDGVAKWTQLERSLSAVLPAVEAHIAMGLVMFPGPDASSTDAMLACEAPAALDATPMFGNASRALQLIQNAMPNGGTPTDVALELAANYLLSEPDALAPQYLVLVTDGGPNCNGALDPNGCRCTSPYPSCSPTQPSAAYDCLDDVRTIATIRDLDARGIPTFVVGLLGTESFGDVLTAMAVAGGEARATLPQYYSAATTSALTMAMNAITSGIADCHFHLDAAPTDPALVDVRLGDMRVPFDPRHRSGWDWTAGSMYMDIQFYGSWCDAVRASTGGTPLVAAFGCAPLPAPP